MSRKTKIAAEIRVAELKKKRRVRNSILAVVAASAILGTGYGYSAYVNSPLQASGTVSFDTNTVHPSDIAFGDPSAPVRVTEYGSMSCAHCARFHSTALPEILEDYVETGDVYFVYRHFPYDNASLAAATVVSCLNEDDRSGAVASLMDSQAQWSRYGDPQSNVVAELDLTGSERAEIEACLADGDVAQAVSSIAFEGRNNGIAGTPSFVIGNEIFSGYLSPNAFGKLISERLLGAEQAPRS